MTGAEIFIFSTAAILTAIIMIPIVRYANRRVREARDLAALGWICVGCDFLTGPIMIPPPSREALGHGRLTPGINRSREAASG